MMTRSILKDDNFKEVVEPPADQENSLPFFFRLLFFRNQKA